MLNKIISGGQTGVDRAALDAALRLDFSCGGWCPKGRRAEDGPISPAYPLEETPTREYAERTRWNVRDADGTLILCPGPPTGGTELTIVFAKLEGRPCLTLDLNQPVTIEPILHWIKTHDIRTLNSAGPRESTAPGVYQQTVNVMESLLSHNTINKHG